MENTIQITSNQFNDSLNKCQECNNISSIKRVKTSKFRNKVKTIVKKFLSYFGLGKNIKIYPVKLNIIKNRRGNDYNL